MEPQSSIGAIADVEEDTTPTQPFGCLECPGVLFDTLLDVIAHFRLEHAIKSETFCAEERKRFYHSFLRSENEQSSKSVCPSDTSPVPLENNSERETPQLNGSLFRKRHGVSPEQGPSKKLRTFQNTSPVGDNKSEDNPSEDTVTTISSSDDTTLDSSSAEQNTVTVIQQATKDVAKGKSSLVISKPRKQTRSASIKRPNPLSGMQYRCPHCNRCLGYSIQQLQRHYRRYGYAGACVTCKTRDAHFICTHCKTDYTTEFTLTNHTKKFNGKCKQYQIDKSNHYLKLKVDVRKCM